MATILMVDDDAEVLALNQKFLSKEGYTVYTSDSPLGSLELVKQIHPDCIILDVMMPQMNGFQLCSKIRAFSACPIIFLTGKSSEDDKIGGLEQGADDYIVKPYSIRELKARIDVLLRRSVPAAPRQKNENLITVRGLTIDRLEHRVSFKGEDLQLTHREYELLLYLVNHPNQDVTYEDLGKMLFGTYQPDDRRIVMVNISRLRKKFSSFYEIENMIETVWSKGYRFVTK